MDVEAFIARWSEAMIRERANCQSFIIQLCAVLGVAAQGQQVVRDRDYCFEQTVNDPCSLDPQRPVNEATQDVAGLFGQLVRAMRERASHDPALTFQPVTDRRIFMFVMQCILAMYADSVGLIRDRGFLTLLESYRGHAARFHLSAASVFRSMARGGYCAALRQDVPAFGGGLFREEAALPLDELELEALISAAGYDWSVVEPDVFGAFLERALEPGDRAELGAHYTPKIYVQRLVEATIIEPLRTDWEALKACALADFDRGNAMAARKTVRRFHRQLCKIRVLDPACGTGNFLYVAMTMMKDLERQVLGALKEFGDDACDAPISRRVCPDQFWGIEKSDHAASIAEVVMWIGDIQWRIRNGEAPSQLARTGALAPRRGRERIITADALLVLSAGEDLCHDARGRPIRLWRFNQETEVVRYPDPRPTQWPMAHFIIGNPPFIAGKNLRRELGDGYVDALWHIRWGRFRSADLDMAWWDRAAEILTAPKSQLRRFGFITTNSITQNFSRRVLEHHLNGEPPMRLVFAIPDHPWSKGPERGAEVRIAMTVAERGATKGQGRLLTIRDECPDVNGLIVPRFDEQQGDIGAELTIGRALSDAQPLKANALLCSPGFKVIDLCGVAEDEVPHDPTQVFQPLTDTVMIERDVRW